MPKVMGIVNVTPDSFSDGGRYFSTDAAIAHGEMLTLKGADIIDVGGESTRPGSQRIDEASELARTIPVVSALAAKGITVSIDTTKAAVALAAVDAGATIINDVSASLYEVAAATGASWIAMHALADSATMQDDPQYDDVVEDIAAFLSLAVRRGQEAGVKQIWVDPGIGFGKTTKHNLEILSNIDRFLDIAPLLVGASRKSVVGNLHALSDAFLGADRNINGHSLEPTPTDDRLEGSVAFALWSVYLGVDMIRVHDVEATVQALSLFQQL